MRGKQKEKQNEKEKGIVRLIQHWMRFVFAIICVLTALCIYIVYTGVTMKDIDSSLERALDDISSNIALGVNDYLYSYTYQIAYTDTGSGLYSVAIANVLEEDLVDADDDGEITVYDINAYLSLYADIMGVDEINLIDESGVIVYSNKSDYVGYDMLGNTDESSQAEEFFETIRENGYYIQEYRPISYDENTQMRYAGVRMETDCFLLDAGGYVQVGFGAELLQAEIDSLVPTAAASRRVGSGGKMIILSDKPDENGLYHVNGITDESMYDEDYDESDESAEEFDFSTDVAESYSRFEMNVDGAKSYCMYSHIEGNYILATIPKSEALHTRNNAVFVMTVLEALAFVALYFLIYRLIMRLVVSDFKKVAVILSQIADGDLEAKVDVRGSLEFSNLSNDVNATVDTLKGYIAEAEGRYEKELEMARQIQYSALPGVFPPYPGRADFDIYAQMTTAKEVGGDFYDFYLIGENRLAFLIADVSGKGIPAALFMMRSKTTLKSLAETDLGVDEVMRLSNDKLCESNEAGMFVTAWLGVLNLKTGEMEFVNAGHNPPLLRRKGGSFEYLRERSGFILAGMEGSKYKKFTLTLNRGDEIFLYTDGVTEAANADNELFGEERLLRLLNKTEEKSAKELCECVKSGVDAFAGGVPQADDITMLSLRLL